MARDPIYENSAYHLGRLFYVLVRAQELALDGVKASIKDRYFGLGILHTGTCIRFLATGF